MRFIPTLMLMTNKHNVFAALSDTVLYNIGDERPPGEEGGSSRVNLALTLTFTMASLASWLILG